MAEEKALPQRRGKAATAPMGRRKRRRNIVEKETQQKWKDFGSERER